MLERVHVTKVPGLYVAHSFMSASRYLVDTRPGDGPRFFRDAGADSIRGRFDGAWQPLTMLAASPIMWADGDYLVPDEITASVEPWQLRVGSEHTFSTPDMSGLHGPVYRVYSSVCRRLERLEDIPAELEMR